MNTRTSLAGLLLFILLDGISTKRNGKFYLNIHNFHLSYHPVANICYVRVVDNLADAIFMCFLKLWTILNSFPR